MQSSPGKPLPPGLKKEVKKVPKLKLLIDRCSNTALIGLEYIVELVLGNLMGPTYYCIQCRENSTTSAIAIAHVTSYNHRLNYLKVHYPSLVANIKPYLSQSNAEKLLTAVLEKICMAIEESYGRLAPTVFETAEFTKNRNALINQIKNGRHFDEASGSVIDYNINLKEVLKAFNSNSKQTAPPKRKERSLSPITSRLKQLRYEASKIGTLNLPSNNEKLINNHRNSSRKNDHSIEGSTSTGNIIERQKKAEEPPKFSTLEDWCKDVQGDLSKSEQYKILIRTIRSAMEKELEKYKENPQSHPLYPSEWDKFWEKRSNEIEAAGEDPYKHNFTKEWSEFFMNRIDELHEADIKRKKLDVRTILGIPLTAALSSYSAASIDRKPTRSPILRNRESSEDTQIENKISGKRKLEVICEDEGNDLLDNLDGVEEPLTVISVLRLLTAFEEMLGSLGPKVVDLLSKAVALEKVRSNLSDELLMSSENSVLLDTVKEKLKGLIIAGMVEGKRLQAIRKAIRNVSDIVRLIDKSNELPKEHSNNLRHYTDEVVRAVDRQPKHFPDTNLSVSSSEKSAKLSISEADRRADVLKQLTTSLMLQGRNISNEHLEELVNVYLANHSPSDTPYLFGLEMGKRLAKMENEQKAAQAAVTAVQSFKSSKKNYQKTRWNRNNDQLAIPNYGSSSNDQQQHFIGGSSSQPQSHVQTVRDNLGWMSSSAYGIGDNYNQGSGSQSPIQSRIQSNVRWLNPQMPYQQPISQYSNVSYGYDQTKGLPPWSGNEQMMRLPPWSRGNSDSQSQYQSNQQQSQRKQHYHLQQNAYCQPPNINMGMRHQQQFSTQNQFSNQMYQNMSPAQMQTEQHQGQWWPNAAGR